MKKICLLFGLGLTLASCAARESDATIELPAGYDRPTVVVSHATIDNLVKARRESDLNVVRDTLSVSNGKVVFPLDPAGAARYSVDLQQGISADFYAAPDETIVMKIESISPLNYTVSGTELMTDMTELAAATNPIEAEYYALSQAGPMTEEQVRPIMERYDQAIRDFVASHPTSPAAPFAILDLQGEDFLKAYEGLTPEARKSIMMPFADAQLPRVQKQVEGDRHRQQMLSGNVDAPGFTLPDLDGKPVSLSDFRGKWVVIDFWGSWCGWCIKGFPKLKEAYNEYGGSLVVIGVDCNEPEDAWRAGVKKYELPWVNVYNNPNDPALLNAYGITGFPTKAIVNPEGKLVDLTVGEDPSFFDRLAKLMK